MDIEVELSRIIINEHSDQQIIVLKERNGERGFPIVIGIVEIFAIDRRLKGIKPPRPMTHDLLGNHTFYAQIHLRLNEHTIEVDSRPSDAIALAAASNTPIFVAEHVFDLTSE
jgi:bifunctional DNase/RNase